MLRPKPLVPGPLLFIAALVTAGCAGAGATPAADDAALTVARGDFHGRLLLTGELQATRAQVVAVPRAPSWQLQIRWLEEDGSRVHAGQRVVELDNSEFAGDLEEKRTAAAEKAENLERDRAEAARRESEKSFAVERCRAEVEKARLAAEVPTELLSGREAADRRLALRRAELELEKAEADLDAERRSTKADLELAEIELARSRREIATAEEAIRALSLTAPTDGLLLIGDHPWEGRKLQAGDSVWVGLPVARIPDLSTLGVEAVLSDVDDGLVEPGMAVTATLDAYPDLRLPGRVEEVAPVAREVERSTLRRYFRVTIVLDQVDLERMRPGMSVKVEVTTDVRPDVLLAPRAALDLGSDPPRAALADGGWAAVDLGPCNAAKCVVDDGLDEGTRLRRPAPEGPA